MADEMGLGKTLMMLSNIARTRKTASAFGHCRSGNDETYRFFSKATLILVPSACKCSHQLSWPTIYLPIGDRSNLAALIILITRSIDGQLDFRNHQVSSISLLTAIPDTSDRHLAPNTLTVCRYHGTRKITNVKLLSDFDVVLTTYATLAAEFSGDCRLHQLTWFRIVLDEGKIRPLYYQYKASNAS